MQDSCICSNDVHIAIQHICIKNLGPFWTATKSVSLSVSSCYSIQREDSKQQQRQLKKSLLTNLNRLKPSLSRLRHKQPNTPIAGLRLGTCPHTNGPSCKRRRGTTRSRGRWRSSDRCRWSAQGAASAPSADPLLARHLARIFSGVWGRLKLRKMGRISRRKKQRSSCAPQQFEYLLNCLALEGTISINMLK